MDRRGGYVIAGMTIVSGLAIATLNPNYQSRVIADRLQQVVVPGFHDIALLETGVHTIFHEHRAIVGGRYFASDRDLSGVQLRLESTSARSTIPLDPPSARTQYRLADREGSSIATFRIGEPGLYRLSAWYSEPTSHTSAVLAIGHGVERRILLATLGSFIVAPAAVGGGVGIAIATFVRNRRAARRPEQ
jgi:hypothetical protein